MYHCFHFFLLCHNHFFIQFTPLFYHCATTLLHDPLYTPFYTHCASTSVWSTKYPLLFPLYPRILPLCLHFFLINYIPPTFNTVPLPILKPFFLFTPFYPLCTSCSNVMFRWKYGANIYDSCKWFLYISLPEVWSYTDIIHKLKIFQTFSFFFSFILRLSFFLFSLLYVSFPLPCIFLPFPNYSCCFSTFSIPPSICPYSLFACTLSFS